MNFHLPLALQYTVTGQRHLMSTVDKSRHFTNHTGRSDDAASAAGVSPTQQWILKAERFWASAPSVVRKGSNFNRILCGFLPLFRGRRTLAHGYTF
jgi:hypothetical protein